MTPEQAIQNHQRPAVTRGSRIRAALIHVKESKKQKTGLVGRVPIAVGAAGAIQGAEGNRDE